MVPRQARAAAQARALVVNSGNANAFTGKTGRQATALTAVDRRQGASAAAANEIFLASTGVIGEPLDATKFDGVLGTLAEHAAPGEWMGAAKAIMTTDTFPKVATATVKLGKAKVTINGMAKGAGMIAPDMATMLSFVFTDAPIAARRAAVAAQERRRGHFQRRHHRRRHLDLGHAARLRDRRRGRQRRAENQPRQRSAAEGLHQGLQRRARRPRRAGGARRRRRAQAGRDHRRRRDDRKRQRAKSRCRSPIRRW